MMVRTVVLSSSGKIGSLVELLKSFAVFCLEDLKSDESCRREPKVLRSPLSRRLSLLMLQ